MSVALACHVGTARRYHSKSTCNQILTFNLATSHVVDDVGYSTSRVLLRGTGPRRRSPNSERSCVPSPSFVPSLSPQSPRSPSPPPRLTPKLNRLKHFQAP
jgi:hypothetical protein